MKKISVIVPCYNVEREIDRCVQSLVAQSLSISNMELIFVDDASEDSTAQKLSVWEAGQHYCNSLYGKWKTGNCQKYWNAICNRRVYRFCRF